MIKDENQKRASVMVFVDTNFWMIPERFKIDIFSELDRLLFSNYEIIVSRGVIAELEKITNTGKGKDKIAAKVGIALIEKKVRKIISSESYVDDLILQLAAGEEEDFVVCTNDKGLMEKIIEKNKKEDKKIKIIRMKEKNSLSFV